MTWWRLRRAAISFLGGLYTSIVTLFGINLKFGADARIETQKATNARELEGFKQALSTQQSQLQDLEKGLDELRQKCELVHRSLKLLETGNWDAGVHHPLHDEIRLLYSVADELSAWGLIDGAKLRSRVSPNG